jgi:nicotinamidase/pyrazinamidase
MKIYVDVDTQHDFCDPEGALFVRNAPAIMDNVKMLVTAAVRRGAPLFGSVDSHDFTAWEFRENGGPFPPHCVKGTRGWLKMSGTLPEKAVFVPNVAGFDPDAVPEGASSILFEKEVYSMFANPSAEAVIDAVLAKRGLARAGVEAIVFGVATDYCVREAALGLVKRGFRVAVVTDAVAAVDEAGGRDALLEMQAAGCRLITAEEAR